MNSGVRLNVGFEKVNKTIVMGTSMAAHIVLMSRNVREGMIAAT